MPVRANLEPLYIKESETAQLLGQSLAWLKRNADTLETTTGFPKIDPVIGLRHRETIEKWARERNQRRTPKAMASDDDGVNWDAF